MTTVRTGQPCLTVVAGIPGSGIEPWLAVHREPHLPRRFYNPDWIARGIGDWDNAETRERATSLMNEIIAKDIRARRSFGLKTSYTTGRTVASVCRLAAEPRLTPDNEDQSLTDYANWVVHMYFIGTRAPTVNQTRVRDAVIERREPYRKPDQLERQWACSIKNMRKTIRLLDEVMLINGTGELATLAVVRHGNAEQRAKRLPAWATTILEGLKPEKTRKAGHQDDAQANA